MSSLDVPVVIDGDEAEPEGYRIPAFPSITRHDNVMGGERMPMISAGLIAALTIPSQNLWIMGAGLAFFSACWVVLRRLFKHDPQWWTTYGRHSEHKLSLSAQPSIVASPPPKFPYLRAAER